MRQVICLCAGRGHAKMCLHAQAGKISHLQVFWCSRLHASSSTDGLAIHSGILLLQLSCAEGSSFVLMSCLRPHNTPTQLMPVFLPCHLYLASLGASQLTAMLMMWYLPGLRGPHLPRMHMLSPSAMSSACRSLPPSRRPSWTPPPTPGGLICGRSPGCCSNSTRSQAHTPRQQRSIPPQNAAHLPLEHPGLYRWPQIWASQMMYRIWQSTFLC